MSEMDQVRLSRTMAFLLRHRPEVGDLTLDGEGWVQVQELCGAVSRLLRSDVEAAQVRHVVEISDVRRFEIREGRIRAVSRRNLRARGDDVVPPDILYHATTAGGVARVMETGRLNAGEGRQLFLSSNEAQAWRAAHRNPDDSPRVLVIDATRARRRGIRFKRHRRNGMYLAPPLPREAVLNLLPDYAEQHSSGGFPVRLGPDGRPRLALIQVTRRSGVTWEVAKGKIEPGETPESAAIREVREEMGITAELVVARQLETVRYGFLAPGGLPRLKIVYLFLLEPVEEEVGDFTPRAAEGIADVRWFTPEQACRVVRHSSLQPVMHRLKHLLKYGLPS